MIHFFEKFMMDNGRKMVDLRKNDEGEYEDDRTHMMGIAYYAAMEKFAGRRKVIDRRDEQRLIWTQPLSVALVNNRKGERRKL